MDLRRYVQHNNHFPAALRNADPTCRMRAALKVIRESDRAHNNKSKVQSSVFNVLESSVRSVCIHRVCFPLELRIKGSVAVLRVKADYMRYVAEP